MQEGGTADLVDREATTASLEELYVRHSTDSRALAFLLVGTHEEAEDLVQEAFVRVAGRLAHLRSRDNFGFYLRRTIINLHVSALRRLKRERALLERERAEGPRSAEIPDVSAREDVWRALQRLPARQRAALVLRYHLDLSEREVADHLRCSVSAAKSLIARGTGSLRQVIGKEQR